MEEKKNERTPRRQMTGTVVTDGANKTIRVRVERLTRHPQYGKYLRKRRTLLAHDETDQARKGDTVRIASCRPYSKQKAWRLVEVVRKAVQT